MVLAKLFSDDWALGCVRVVIEEKWGSAIDVVTCMEALKMC